MSHNPYAVQSDSAVASTEEPVTRLRWVALLLALFVPPVAMLYLGRPGRALAYLLATHGVSLAVVAIALSGVMVIGAWAIYLPLLAMLVAAVDAWRLAPGARWVHPPWYSRGAAVLGAFVLSIVIPLGIRFAVAEPYRIPSTSMEPTLRLGDQIIVDKHAYGWSNPFGGERLARFAAPARGDVAVFWSPMQPKVQYVKRVVGVPGDRIEYSDRRLTLNGQAVARSLIDGGPLSLGFPANDPRELHREGEGTESHFIFLNPPEHALEPGRGFVGDEACTGDQLALRCTVPAGQYFVLGDNRDNSQDSRHFGFISEDAFIGRVTTVWGSEADPGRAGRAVR